MGKRQRKSPRSADDNQQRDIRTSRRIFIASLLLLVVVALGDTIYVALQLAKNRSHIYIPAIVVAAPFAALFFVVMSWWNWWAVLRRANQPSVVTTTSRS